VVVGFHPLQSLVKVLNENFGESATVLYDCHGATDAVGVLERGSRRKGGEGGAKEGRGEGRGMRSWLPCKPNAGTWFLPLCLLSEERVRIYCSSCMYDVLLVQRLPHGNHPVQTRLDDLEPLQSKGHSAQNSQEKKLVQVQEERGHYRHRGQPPG